jgi:hypothetical protein
MADYRPTSPEFPRSSKTPGAAAAWAKYDRNLKAYNASKTARANKALHSEKDAPALMATYTKNKAAAKAAAIAKKMKGMKY